VSDFFVSVSCSFLSARSRDLTLSASLARQYATTAVSLNEVEGWREEEEDWCWGGGWYCDWA